MSEGDQKPGASPSVSVNPFAPKNSHNPFASPSSSAFSQGNSTPTGSHNPFAQNSSSASLNPFASQAPSPSTSMNPFSSQAPTPTTSANPFANEAPVQSNPTSSVAPSVNQANVQLDALSQMNGSESTQNRFDSTQQPVIEEADPQLLEKQAKYKELAPLNFASVDDAPNEFEAALNYQTNQGIERNHVIMIAAGAGALMLILGLVMGSAFSERRVYNARISAWQEINEVLDTKFADYDAMKDTLTSVVKPKVSKKTKRLIFAWKKITKLPEIDKISTSLLTPSVPLEPQDMIKLTSLVLNLNELFDQVKLLKLAEPTLRSQVEFEKYGQYAVLADQFFNACKSRNKLRCSLPDPKNPPRGELVAIQGQLKKNKIKVVSRYNSKARNVDARHLIAVSAQDAKGSDAMGLYARISAKINRSMQNIEKYKKIFTERMKTKSQESMLNTL